MQRLPEAARSALSTWESPGGGSEEGGCEEDGGGSPSERQARLFGSCADGHPRLQQARRDARLRKGSFLRAALRAALRSLAAPFLLAKRACCALAPGGSRCRPGKLLVPWAALCLVAFGASHVGLLDRGFRLLGGSWRDFSLCDCLLGEAKDLRSLQRATQVLERKASEIPLLREGLREFESRLRALSSDVHGRARWAVGEALRSYAGKGVSTWGIRKMLKETMGRVDEDGVQRPDYALRSAGACIVHARTSRSYRHAGGGYFWGPVKVLPFVKSADAILQPDRSPGSCWPFPGHQGEAVVKLAMGIIPTAITIDHISKNVSPTGEISSAPKEFAVYGLKEADEEDGAFLGQFVYDAEGNMVQTFEVKGNSSRIISYVKLKVLSNWGHPKYTCIYRFRVHGDLGNG